MNRKSRAYVAGVSLLGLATIAVCVSHYVRSLIGVPFGEYGARMIFFIVLCATCRSFPVSIRKEQALDLSVISILAAFLCDGMEAAMVVYLISSLFTFERDENGVYHSIYNTSLAKTVFNTSDIVIAILLPGLVCRLLPWSPGEVIMPNVILPAVLFSLLTFVVNYFVLLLMFVLKGDISLSDAVKGLTGLTPNVLAAMPLGLIIALLLSMQMGPWLALLMMCPMLLARYAWKLYLNVTHHKDELLTAFVAAMEARDTYTQGHSKRVGEYAESIARQMKLSAREIRRIHEGALLHDIGKIGVSDLILHKPAPLDRTEWEAMRRHPAVGAEIVASVGLDAGILEMIRSHHERCDGKGYPDGIPSEKLSLATRILTVADAFDAMTSDRPYRKGMAVKQALEEVERGISTQFDSDAAKALLVIMRDRGEATP